MGITQAAKSAAVTKGCFHPCDLYPPLQTFLKVLNVSLDLKINLTKDGFPKKKKKIQLWFSQYGLCQSNLIMTIISECVCQDLGEGSLPCVPTEIS